MSKGLLLGLCGGLFLVGFARAATDNIITPVSCTASATYSIYVCDRVYDGSIIQAWNPASNAGEYVTLDYGTSTPIVINNYTAMFGADGTNAFYNGGTMKVSASNDGSTWTDLNLATSTADTFVFTQSFQNTTAYRYYRWTETNNGFNDGITELTAQNIVIATSTATSTATTTPDTPTAQVGFLVLSMLIFGTGIFLAMWIF